MVIFRRIAFASLCAALAVLVSPALGQTRDRVVKPTSSQPINAPASPSAPVRTETGSASRPVLTNEIRIVRNDAAYEPPVAKTSSTSATRSVASMVAAGRAVYNMDASIRLDAAIKERYGLPYRYGSTGPNSYDCSGFIWSAFRDAGINFTRGSARGLWNEVEQVYGDDRFKFGTIVFLNGLGHVGIVADENGFYHASSSKGITYSPFKGYWQNRIVGFGRLRSPSADLR